MGWRTDAPARLHAAPVSVAEGANANCQLTAIYETASQHWQGTGAVAPALV